jgi:hypothetical protein
MRTFPLLLLTACCTTPAFAQTLSTFDTAKYPAATAPRAIASADFDRDGWLDVVTAGRNGLQVLRNTHGQSFVTGFTARRSGAGAFDIAAGDLNRDAIPDLVVAQADAHTVDIYIGNGDGTFDDFAHLPITGGNPRGLTLIDYDLNGTLDIIVTEYATGAWRILYGDGSGAIARQERFSSIANPQGVVAADFNRDGRTDVAIAGAGINLIAVFLSTPEGGLVQRNVTVGAAVNVLASGDFNRDGWPDLAAASTSNSRIYTMLGSATGLTWKATNASGSSPRGILATDINGDGRPDLVTANRASNAVNVHLGTGAGTFAAPQAIAAGSGSRDVTAGDFDHDGRRDLATIDEFGNSATVLSNATAFVAPAFRFTRQTLDTNPGSSGPYGVETGDFDRDGRVDAVTWAAGIDVRLQGQAARKISSAFVNDVAVADLNGDGALDLAAADYWQRSVLVFINRGDSTFEERSIALATPVIRLDTADFNHDGRTDIVVQEVQDGTLQGIFRFLLGRGDGTFAPAAGDGLTIPYAQEIEIADLDRDGNLDIIGASGSWSNVVVWFGKGDGTASRVATYPMPRGIVDIAIADLNEDGLLDAIAAYDSWVYVRLGLSGGDFAPPTEHLATLRADNVFVYDIGVGDVNLDGHIDVVTNDADILYGNGDGSFTFNGHSGFDGYYQDPMPVDYNGDGLLDLLFNEGGGLVIMLNARGGTNQPPSVSAGPDLTVSYVITNGYGDDFALAASGSDPDLHELRYEWRDGTGIVIATGQYFFPPNLRAGRYTFTVTGYDGRGGQASDSMVLTVQPFEEVYLNVLNFDAPHGAWRQEDDTSTAGGIRLRHPNANAPKVTVPLASPANYVEARFPADPTQVYKLWLRLKADGNSWANDSVFVQFEGATDANGSPVYQIGSTSALEVNLEECSGCGISGWGWEDDGWGAKDRNGTARLRFPSGVGQIRIQTREDGVAIDQVVLSSKRFATTRPGTAKNDTTILPMTVPADQ